MSANQYFELMLSNIEEKKYKLSDFDDETLFFNIFYCYNFIRWLSPYFKWGERAILRLKSNIRKKWPENDSLTDVEYFIHLIEEQNKAIDPNEYFFNSESYLMKFMFLKPVMDVSANDFNNNNNNNNKIVLKRKPIR